MSWYSIDGVILGRISLVKDIENPKSSGMIDDDWPWRNWDPSESIDGNMSQKFVWDPSIECFIHGWLAQRHGVTQWFVWDPSINVQMPR